MGTTKLKVGQDVYLEAGVYGLDGKVVKITSKGVEVQTNESPSSRLLRFDKEGKQRGQDPLFEGGPWYIVGATKWVVGQDVFVMNWEGYFIDGKVIKATPGDVEVNVVYCRRPEVWRFNAKRKAPSGYWDSSVHRREFGPSEIDETAFEERKAWLEAAADKGTHRWEGHQPPALIVPPNPERIWSAWLRAWWLWFRYWSTK